MSEGETKFRTVSLKIEFRFGSSIFVVSYPGMICKILYTLLKLDMKRFIRFIDFRVLSQE